MRREMQHMKYKGFMPAILFLLVLFLCTGCERRQAMEIYMEETEPVGTESAVETEQESGKESLFVDVRGAVVNPGVYELSAKSRVYEAIEAAGGLLPEAEERAVNQAALLSDGQQIYIPAKGEETPETALAMETDGRVNINTASAGELTSLPGIGESRAADIIAYRESNGGFSSIEDIMQVSGIKDALFQKIKDKIKV